MTQLDLATAVQDALPGVLADLTDLIAIPSVSSLPAHDADVQRCAEVVAGLLTASGCPDVRIVAEGGKPAVLGRFPAPEGAPTVCLYAHYDVQPVGETSQWTSPPWQATRRGDRLFGRGAADDKGGIAVHLGALRAFGGRPPVGVTVFVEGEEEIGSPSLAALMAAHHEELAADVFVIADSGNWEVGVPGLTTTLRGLAEAYVEVRTLSYGVHSGEFGGAVPDALTALCKLLGTLVDDTGACAIEGINSYPGPDLEYPLDRLRAEAGLLDGVPLIGSGPLAQRLWTAPAVSVLAIDAPAVAQASNILVPRARAKVSVRVAPGDDAVVAQQALVSHLERHTPYGVQVEVTPGESGQPGIIGLAGPVADAARAAFTEAFGVQPVPVGQGGSIPMVADFQAAFGEATVLVTAVTDPDSRIHGLDESLHLGDFAKAVHAEALLLAKLAPGA